MSAINEFYQWFEFISIYSCTTFPANNRSSCCPDFRFCKDLEDIAFDLGIRKGATAQEVYDTLVERVEELTHAQEAGQKYKNNQLK